MIFSHFNPSNTHLSLVITLINTSYKYSNIQSPNIHHIFSTLLCTYLYLWQSIFIHINQLKFWPCLCTFSSHPHHITSSYTPLTNTFLVPFALFDTNTILYSFIHYISFASSPCTTFYFFRDYLHIITCRYLMCVVKYPWNL